MASNISGNFIENELINAQRGMATWIIEVTKLKFEAGCDLQGQMEVTMASEATNMAVRANVRAINAFDFKYEVKLNHYHYHSLRVYRAIAL